MFLSWGAESDGCCCVVGPIVSSCFCHEELRVTGVAVLLGMLCLHVSVMGS